jgi:hypothetical protein
MSVKAVVKSLSAKAIGLSSVPVLSILTTVGGSLTAAMLISTAAP